ncbi:GTPase [Acinetobacter sp. B51(2017)]|uniref:GTPase n=1 Tax=Acinetobacter sp. B51(2017) TaxID=2060938 RepID=UPI000F0917EF|nr:GTPase [Acinetobacter sp. B51(2017)]
MTMQASDLFQTPTQPKLDKLSFCHHSIQGVQDWVSTLSILQLGDSSKTLFNALLEISELNCSEALRFDLIQALHPTLENVLLSLEKHFLNQGLISSDRNDHIIELATLLRCYFSKIYIDIAKRSHQQLQHQPFSLFAFRKKRNLSTVRIMATYYALQQISALFYQQHMLYSAPLPGQWLIAHQLLSLAIEHHFDQTNINHIQGTEHKLNTVAQAYARLILLEVFNTHQIRPTEIQALYLCSVDWARLVQVLPKETTLSRYAVDTQQDHPPMYNNNHAKSLNPNIYIATQKLLEHFSDLQRKQSEYLSSNEKNLLTPALHFHIQNLLSNQTGRRSERYDYSAPLQICFSLAVAHFYLSKGKAFYETLELNHGYKLQNTTSLFGSQNSHNSSPEPKFVDREARQIYSADVINISLNGYRIRWTGETPKNLKTGELILVQENTHSQWRCATIRWIKQATEKTLELGIEILAQHMYPCAVHIRNENTTNNYHFALLTQNVELDLVKNSLILPGLPIFREKQTVFLRLGNTEIKVYLVKTLLITQSFMQFEYELLDEAQHAIIENFIHKKQYEVSNHDLWETLK